MASSLGEKFSIVAESVSREVCYANKQSYCFSALPENEPGYDWFSGSHRLLYLPPRASG